MSAAQSALWDLHRSFSASHKRDLRQFHALCKKLSQNDAKTTDVFVADMDLFDYGKELGPALQNNTRVSDLRLDLEKTISSKLRTEFEALPDENERKDRIARHLDNTLQFIRQGPALERVKFRNISYTSPCENTVKALFLEAVYQNDNIQNMSFSFIPVPALSFREYMRSTSTLKELSVGDWDPQSTPEERHLIEEGFALVASLKILNLDCERDTATSILSGLARNEECDLNRLEVRLLGRGDTTSLRPALSLYLHSRKEPLAHLTLHGFTFTAESMSAFCLGLLQPPQDDNEATFGSLAMTSHSRTLVSELAMQGCGWQNKASIIPLRDFLQTRVAVSSSPPLLAKLILRSGDYEWYGPYRVWTSSDLVAMLCSKSTDGDQEDKGMTGNQAIVKTNALYPTIGSQIQCLDVDQEHSSFRRLYSTLAEQAEHVQLSKLRSFRRLYSTLAEQAEHVQLSKLRIPPYEDLCRDDIVGLAQCISKVSSLQELDFDFVFSFESPNSFPSRILASLRENGTIQSVKTAIKSRHIQAYCQRNQMLGKLLMQSSAGSLTGPAAAATTPEVEENDITSTSFCPTLWQVGNQIPAMQPATFLRTLLRFQDDDSIGRLALPRPAKRPRLSQRTALNDGTLPMCADCSLAQWIFVSCDMRLVLPCKKCSRADFRDFVTRQIRGIGCCNNNITTCCRPLLLSFGECWCDKTNEINPECLQP